MNLSLFLGTLFLALLAGVLYLAYIQALPLVYPPPYPADVTPAIAGLPYEDIRLTTSDGITLAAWYVPPPQDGGGVVVYVHGLAANRSQQLNEAAWLYELGYGAMLFDLRNHGESGGEVTTMGVTEIRDVRAALDYVLTRPEVNPQDIVLHGNSLGGATALLSAAQMPEFRAVAVLNPYSALVDVVGDQAWELYHLPPRPVADFVVWFANGMSKENLYLASPKSVIDQIAPRPIFIAHGTADTTIPVVSTYRLAEGRDNITTWIVDGVEHSSFTVQVPDEYRERFIAFIQATAPTRN